MEIRAFSAKTFLRLETPWQWSFSEANQFYIVLLYWIPAPDPSAGVEIRKSNDKETKWTLHERCLSCSIKTDMPVVTLSRV